MANPARMRFLFAGSPEFAVPSLLRLIRDGFPPVGVLTQPDRPSGRGRRLQASPVKLAAAEAGIAVYQPETMGDENSLRLVTDLEPDLMIVVAYGQILPPEILRVPGHGCWNVHASLLPRWRGAAPIQRAIEAGDRETGVCIMQMDEGLDTGPILHRVSIALTGEETGGMLHDRLAEIGAAALLECVRRLAGGAPPEARVQAGEGVSYAPKLRKDEARIDWTDPAEALERRIRAFNPWPVSWCMVGEERTRVWKSRLVDREHDVEPGAVLASGSSGIDVATGRKILRLLELQRPGKRRMSAADYLNAMSLPARLNHG